MVYCLRTTCVHRNENEAKMTERKIVEEDQENSTKKHITINIYDKDSNTCSSTANMNLRTKTFRKEKKLSQESILNYLMPKCKESSQVRSQSDDNIQTIYSSQPDDNLSNRVISHPITEIIAAVEEDTSSLCDQKTINIGLPNDNATEQGAFSAINITNASKYNVKVKVNSKPSSNAAKMAPKLVSTISSTKTLPPATIPTKSSSESDDLTSLSWLQSLDMGGVVPHLAVPPTPPASPQGQGSGPTDETNSEPPKKIDYSVDGTVKPPYSYAALIGMAMKENDNKMTLSAIYKWIKEHFVFYKTADQSWQVINQLSNN